MGSSHGFYAEHEASEKFLTISDNWAPRSLQAGVNLPLLLEVPLSTVKVTFDQWFLNMWFQEVKVNTHLQKTSPERTLYTRMLTLLLPGVTHKLANIRWELLIIATIWNYLWNCILFFFKSMLIRKGGLAEQEKELAMWKDTNILTDHIPIVTTIYKILLKLWAPRIYSSLQG